MTADAPPPAARFPVADACRVLGGLSLLGLIAAPAVGYLVGGTPTATAALAGMGAAVSGAVLTMLLVLRLLASGVSVTIAPTLGMIARLALTAGPVAGLLLVFQLPIRPVMFAALAGYLLLMAAEAWLLYRAAPLLTEAPAP